MNSKLTLSIDKSVITSAKKYAKTHQISVSKLVENYLKFVSQDKSEKIKINTILNDMKTGVRVPNEINYKDQYRNHLENKLK